MANFLKEDSQYSGWKKAQYMSILASYNVANAGSLGHAVWANKSFTENAMIIIFHRNAPQQLENWYVQIV